MISPMVISKLFGHFVGSALQNIDNNNPEMEHLIAIIMTHIITFCCPEKINIALIKQDFSFIVTM